MSRHFREKSAAGRTGQSGSVDGAVEMSVSVAVVGAGASGLLAAVTAARAGAKVLLIDGNPQVGRKLLSTGNGRCNFANRRQDRECYRSEEPEAVWAVLEQFPVERVLSFFEESGIRATERNGYYYPYTNAAADVRACLEMEIRRLGIRTALGYRVLKIEKESGRFRLQLVGGANGKLVVSASSCILATGGQAFPKSGSDGAGYALAESFGHTVIPVTPALVELRCNEKFFHRLKGIRLAAGVRLLVDGEPVARDSGEVQLTERGISGIPVFNVSRYATRALAENGMGFASHDLKSAKEKKIEPPRALHQKRVTAELDLLPELSAAEAADELKQRLWNYGWGKSVLEAFCGLFHPRLSAVLLKRAGVEETADAAEADERQVKGLAEVCKAFGVSIAGAGGFDKAQTTAGGVPLSEVDAATLESVCCKGLYLCGELLDVDGICGGYNLGWAWASGFVCGAAAAKIAAQYVTNDEK